MTFIKDESGLETVEVAILVGLIAAGLIAVIFALRGWVARHLNSLKDGLPVGSPSHS